MLKFLFIPVLICFIINMPIGYALGVASMAFVILNGLPVGQWVLVPQRIAMSINSFPLLAIPYFMVAGAVMEMGGVSRRIINLASAIVGHIKGGIASAAIISCAIFAAISGSTPATAAAIGSITIPEMVKRKYPADYSSAVVASSACLGVIIPPSITMVIFATTCNVSVGKTLIGGILPGIVLAAMLCVTNYFFCRKAGYETEPKQNGREVWLAFKDAVWALLMPVIILGGIMSGIFTPTESAAVAIFYGLIIGFFVYKELKLKDLVPLFYKAALNSAMIMLLIGCSGPFGWIMTSNKVPQIVANAILGISTNYYVIYGMVLVLFLILGTFMETASIIMLTVPILYPIMVAIGADMIHFAVVGVIALAIGMATPPVGISLFATCPIGKVTMGQISSKVWPFLIVMILGLFLFMFVPQITLLIPNLFMP
ncbi:MAG: TRAP transporter large permease [Oscillospiraceae bacterium]|nr:TRAP transporter large permease [Oscillospiraceae bacterium]